MWRKIGLVAVSCVIAIPLLLAGEYVDLHPVIRAVVFSLAYLAVYLVALRRMRIAEVELIWEKLLRRIVRR